MDTIVGEMMFNPSDDDDSYEYNDVEEDPGFGSPAELQALLDQRRATATKARDRALSLFKKVKFEDGDYSYSVTIPKTKTNVVGLVGRYVSCGTSFCMAASILGCTYDVLASPGLRACSQQDVSNFIRVVCAVNLQRIARHLRRSWAFSIALNSATHQSTSYLDFALPNFYSSL